MKDKVLNIKKDSDDNRVKALYDVGLTEGQVFALTEYIMYLVSIYRKNELHSCEDWNELQSRYGKRGLIWEYISRE